MYSYENSEMEARNGEQSPSTLGELNNAIARLLSVDLNLKEKVILTLPAHLTLLFGLLLLVSSIVAKVAGDNIPLPEFLAILVTGCVLVAIGALLYIFQFVVEQETVRTLSRLARDTPRDVPEQKAGPEPTHSDSPSTSVTADTENRR
jgi:hypothetical protein